MSNYCPRPPLGDGQKWKSGAYWGIEIIRETFRPAMTLHVSTSLLALLAYGVLLALVLRHGRHGHRPSQVFSLYLLAMALMQVCYLMLSLSDSAGQALLWYTFIMPTVCGLVIVTYFFTRSLLGLDLSRRRVEAGLLVWLLTAAVSAGPARPLIYTTITRDQATGLFVPEFGPLAGLLAIPLLGFLGPAVANLLRGYRDARLPRERMRFQYLLLAIGVVAAGMLANLSPHLRPYPIDVASQVLSASLISYAILRYQLLDISLVVRKGLLYSMSSIILGAGYFLLIYFTSTLFHGLRGAQVFLLALAAAILAAVAAQPLRDWLQGWLDRLFFRDQYDSGLMIQRLSQAAASTLDLGQLLAAILDDVTRTMRIGWAALFLEQEGEMRPMARRGLAADLDVRLRKDHPLWHRLAEHNAALSVEEAEQDLGGAELEQLRQIGAHVLVPLCAGSSLVGILALGPRLSGQGYTQHDEQALTTLANQTALAVAKARLYQAVQQELAERTRAEAELRRLKEFNEGIIQNLVAGIVLQDARGMITFANPAAAASLGYTPAELPGLPWTAIVPADQHPIAQAADERRRAGQADQHPLDMVRKDGERISVLMSGTPRLDAGSGQFLGTLAVFIDISERVRLEEQLRQAQKMEAVGQLAAGIAHDFNNLLMVINGFAEWMQWQLLSDDPLQGPLNHIQAAGGRAAGLVKQLLGFARKQMIQPQVLDLNLLVEGIGSQLKPALGELIQLETSLAPGLWPVKIDPGQVEQILTQLIANARDAMPAGGRLTIETANLVLPHLTLHPFTAEDEEKDRGEYVRLAVSDTGYGMSLEVQAHLFEPFFTTKEVGQGSGLGLATVYGIVKQNRGDIQVSSQPGQGTTVRIYLPRAQADTAGGDRENEPGV